MKRLALFALMTVGCGGIDSETNQSAATVSRDWRIELTGVCAGSMTTAETHTVDMQQRPYATYYSGTWTCGTLAGSMEGAVDARTKHFAINLFPGGVAYGVVGFMDATGALSGTATTTTGEVAFSAK
jgi:hypothetical protein